LRSREGRCRPPLFEGGTDDKPPRHDPKSIATRELRSLQELEFVGTQEGSRPWWRKKCVS
jgi:hypothetical protein